MKIRLTKDNAIYFWGACKDTADIQKLRGFGIDITNKSDLDYLYFNGLIQNEFEVDSDISKWTMSVVAEEAEMKVNHLLEAIRTGRLIAIDELKEKYPHLFKKRIAP